MTTIELSPGAQHWGAQWGSRPADWAASEEQQTPVYEAALDQAPIRPGDRVLDVGCGTGVFLRMCADRGATTSGIDAAQNLLTLARQRVPAADLRHGDMQALPFPHSPVPEVVREFWTSASENHYRTPPSTHPYE